MTREIKFRAVVDGKIQPVFAIKYRSDGVFVLVGDEISSTTYNINDIILQQFTGLKDKNGVDIYEGDILKYKTSKNQYSEVKFKYDGFKISSFRTPTTTVTSNLHYFLDKYDCCVVGNIYENKDLLSNTIDD